VRRAGSPPTERAHAPAEVSLRVRPASVLSEDEAARAPLVGELLAEVGARVDGAYWVGAVVVAGADARDVTGVVELTSGCTGRRRGEVTSVERAGVDGPSPHLLTGIAVAEAAGPSKAVISGRLVAVASLSLDLGRAGCSGIPQLDVQSDREVTVTFLRDGRPVGQEVVPPPGLARSPRSEGTGERLPATGCRPAGPRRRRPGGRGRPPSPCRLPGLTRALSAAPRRAPRFHRAGPDRTWPCEPGRPRG